MNRSKRVKRLVVLFIILLSMSCSTTGPSPHTGQWELVWHPLFLSGWSRYSPVTVDGDGHAAVSDTMWYKTAPLELVFQVLSFELTLSEGGSVKGSGTWGLSQGLAQLTASGDIKGQIEKSAQGSIYNAQCVLHLYLDDSEHLLRFNLSRLVGY